MEIEGSTPKADSKKNSLEELSKEDLIKKCKGLLALAQRAKTAKDEYAMDNKVLQEEILFYKNQKEIDEKQILAMSEVTEFLTENKLKLISDISTLREEQERMKLAVCNTNTLEVKLESLQRQNNRLTTENDELLASLENLDGSSCKNCENYLKEKKDNNDKIERIKIRLKDLASKVNRLKNSKHILLETQKEYANSVTKWQEEIVHGSRQLYAYLQKVESEKNKLQKQVLNQNHHPEDIVFSKAIPVLIDLCDKSILQLKALERKNVTLTTKLLETEKSINPDFEKCNELCHDLSEINHFQEESIKGKTEKALGNIHVESCDKLVDKRTQELLAEMRELNEVLKSRGDMISTQQHKIENLQKEIESSRSEKNKLEHEISRLTTQEMQRDTLSVSTISKIDDADRLKDVDDSLEDRFNKMKIMAVKLKKKCQQQSEAIQKCMCDKHRRNIQALQIENDKLLDQVEDLKKNKSTHDVVTPNENEKCLQEKIDELKQGIEKQNLQIEENNLEIQKLKSAKKKSNVLTLEVEAYEKSLNEVSEKLRLKFNENDLIKQDIESKQYKIESLEKQVTLLEENIQGEKTHTLELKQQIDNQNLKIKTQEQEKQDIQKNYESLTIENELLKSKRDELQLNLSEYMEKYDSSSNNYQREKHDLLMQINILNEELTNISDKLLLKSKEYENLNDEFLSYKVKAQNVLRLNQNKESEREKELEQELIEVKAEIFEVNRSLKTVTEQYKKCLSDLNRSKEELVYLQNKSSELRNLLDGCRQQNELLLEDMKVQNSKFQDTLKAHRIQIDTINEFYSSQIAELEKCNNEKDMRMEPSGANLQTAIAKSSDEENIDLLLLEREDAEGSESNIHTLVPKRKISIIQTRSRHDIVPLDELLNASSDIIYNIDDEDLNVHNLKTELSTKNNQVVHLRSILSETEQDLAKITQQNDLLKEEIRKNERATERMSHLQNSEYLKNVVLKFLTLNNGDEKSRLVPVLNTILKLNKKENEILENVTKGKGNDSGRSWGNLLWSNN